MKETSMELTSEMLHSLIVLFQKILDLASKSDSKATFNDASVMFENAYSVYGTSLSGRCASWTGIGSYGEIDVIVAEAALATGHVGIASSIIRAFLFSDPFPPQDQVYCRAKLVHAIILLEEAQCSTGLHYLAECRFALSEISDVLKISCGSSNLIRYGNIIYNASLVGWQLVRNFIREKRGYFLKGEIVEISDALALCHDHDMKWRITIMVASSRCFEDGTLIKEATEMLDIAARQGEQLLYEYNLRGNELSFYLEELSRSSDEILLAVQAFDDMEERRRRPPKIDPDLDEAKSSDGNISPKHFATTESDEIHLPAHLAELGLGEIRHRKIIAAATKARTAIRLKSLQNDFGRPCTELCCKLALQRIKVNSTELKKVQESEGVSNSPRELVLTHLQSAVSGAITESQTADVLDICKVIISSNVTSSLLKAESYLDCALIAWSLGLRGHAQEFQKLADNTPINAAIVRVKREFCQALHMTFDLLNVSTNQWKGKCLNEKQMKGLVADQRVEAIQLLERILTISTTQGFDPCLVQNICLSIWSIGIPLLLPHSRFKIQRALLQAVSALEEIQSPLYELRTRMRWELSKYEESIDFVSRGLLHAKLALSLDYGVTPSDQLSTSYSRSHNDGDQSRFTYLPRSDVWHDIEQTIGYYDSCRALDIAIIPLSIELSLRCNVYKAPVDAHGQVLLLVQRVKETTSKRTRESLISQALDLIMFDIAIRRSNKVLDSINGYLHPYYLRSLTDDRVDRPVVSIDELEFILAAPISDNFEVFTLYGQERIRLLTTICDMAFSDKILKSFELSATYLLSLRWDSTKDLTRTFVYIQCKLYSLLTEALVYRLQDLPLELNIEFLDPFHTKKEKHFSHIIKNINSGMHPSIAAAPLLDPRSIGVHSEYESSAMKRLKKLINACIMEGLQVASLSSNPFCIQNGIIHVWNMHLHIFREESKFHSLVSTEFVDIVKYCVRTLENSMKHEESNLNEANTFKTPSLCPRESFGLEFVGAAAELLQFREDDDDSKAMAISIHDLLLSKAHIADKIGFLYRRRRLADLLGRLSVRQEGYSGGKDSPKIDDPLLLNYFLVAQGETMLTLPEQTRGNRSSVVSLCERVEAHLEADEIISSLKSDDDRLTQNNYNQIMEMHTELYTRATRLRIFVGNIQEAQDNAIRCSISLDNFIESWSCGLSKLDGRESVHPGIARWISACERHFGVSISELLTPSLYNEEGEGNKQEIDEQILRQLQLSALRHYYLACDWGAIARELEAVIVAATWAWNTVLNLVDVGNPTVYSNLVKVQKKILTSILSFKEELGSHSSYSEIEKERAHTLVQLIYLVLIDYEIESCEWNHANDLLIQAFENLPSSLLKPLWKRRIIVMTKKGESVLDSLQKLKDGDKYLQAEVLSTLARFTDAPKQQLRAYMDTISSLKGESLRVEYIFECCQWMGTAGLNKSVVKHLLDSALSLIYGKVEGFLSLQNIWLCLPKYFDPKLCSVQISDTLLKTSHSKYSQNALSALNNGTEEKISPLSSLTMVDIDQALRGLGMGAILSTDEDERTKFCVEACYFVVNGIGLWNAAMEESYKVDE
jgi:hypothetical protein